MEEQKEEKKSFFSKLAERFRKKEKDMDNVASMPIEAPKEEGSQEQKPQDPIREDMKTVGKLAFAAIKKLPPAQLEEYKKSEDFTKLKELLKKYEIIKEN